VSSEVAPFLIVRELRKSYPDGWTLERVSFCVAEGETLCLLGPSGCGKTTLLRLIAGLELPEGGQVIVDGVDVTHLPPHRRGFGLMFQEYALFPHKDVLGNVAFGLRMAGWERTAIRQRVGEVLALVGLAGFERRDVNRLSGGERQRVALARSLAPNPRLLMLDEPLGALDRSLRERLLSELPAILRQVGVTSITVTHDQEEAFAIADRLLVMRDGRVVQQGAPAEVYRRPASTWVARFLGLSNLLDARVVGPGVVETALGRLTLAAPQDVPSPPLSLLIRPEAARPGSDGPNRLQGTVVERAFRGSACRLTLRCGDERLVFEWPAIWGMPAVGETVAFTLEPEGLTLVAEEEDGGAGACAGDD
jgi:ABC-type Fe3+/spermidine/putrescine transport system ATPase subunit